jgi:hypothetical protein
MRLDSTFQSRKNSERRGLAMYVNSRNQIQQEKDTKEGKEESAHMDGQKGLRSHHANIVEQTRQRVPS